MSEPLHARLDEIREQLCSGQGTLLLLDFDGTLAPFVPDPAGAALPAETRDALRALNGRAGTTVAILTGRSIEDVRPRVGLNVIYAGNHGLEICGPGFAFRQEQAAAWGNDLRRMCARISEELRQIPGTLVENKALTASVHFRRAPDDRLDEIGVVVRRETEPYADRFLVKRGKKTFDILPRVAWNKGSAAHWIRDRFPEAVPVAIGDDVTDEDAFQAVADGITIRVGAGRTRARYCVRDARQVLAFLRWILSLELGRREDDRVHPGAPGQTRTSDGCY
jgi:trehalose 6-phosphate phosphatase